MAARREEKRLRNIDDAIFAFDKMSLNDQLLFCRAKMIHLAQNTEFDLQAVEMVNNEIGLVIHKERRI
jgi:hypothetical protein